jgi:hypothetical protein
MCRNSGEFAVLNKEGLISLHPLRLHAHCGKPDLDRETGSELSLRVRFDEDKRLKTII